MSFTLGSLLFMASFAVLIGPLNCELQRLDRNRGRSREVDLDDASARPETYLLERTTPFLSGLLWVFGINVVLLYRSESWLRRLAASIDIVLIAATHSFGARS